MKNLFSPKIVLFLVIVAVALPVTAIEYSVLRQTSGTFMYPLDDVFIHMALAKNLANYHNWGISQHEFASASSSVLYTLLLAGLFRIFSVQVIIPFLINCVTGLVLLVVLQRWLRKEKIHNGPQLVLLLCIVFFSPLPILLICGMEHTLQCLFAFLFIFGFSDWLEGNLVENKKKWELPWSLILYGMMGVFIRYEGLFLVAIACLILAGHRKMTIAFKLGFLAILPLLIFGIYSVLKGSYFLPNSVLLKSDSAPLSLSGLIRSLDNILVQRLTIVKTDNIPAGTPRPGISLLATQRLLVILPLTWFVFRKYIREKAAYGYILLMLTACTLLQLSFASTGWLYRYEAYLIFCSVTIIGVLFYKYGKAVLAEMGGSTPFTRIAACGMMGVILFALLFPLVLRSTAAFSKTGTACINIYEQQYQMGQFLHRYYDKEAAAANDIGAVSFFTSGPDLDLWGLGNIKVARSRKKNYWTPQFLDSLCRESRVKLAIVYDDWFDQALLQRWTKVATWQIRNNVICGGDTVSFYAVEKDGAPVLRKNLEAYARGLPPDVTVRYY
jgi:hypothetical protein